MSRQAREIIIRPLQYTDKFHWLMLWQNYLDACQTKLPITTTEHTFTRLCSGQVFVGLVACDGQRLLGFIHMVFQPSTWTMHNYCYIEDLYICASERNKKIATHLLKYACQLAKQRDSQQVYWFTHKDNQIAQALYNKFAQISPFIIYRHKLK